MVVRQWPHHLEEPRRRRRSAEKSQREAPASCPPSAEMVQVSTHQDWVSAVMHGPGIPGLCCLGARHGKKQVQFRCSDGSPVKTLRGEVEGMREMVVSTREQQEGAGRGVTPAIMTATPAGTAATDGLTVCPENTRLSSWIPPTVPEELWLPYQR